DGVKVHESIEDAIKNADVINVLRIQLERQQAGLFPSTREYARVFGINDDRLTLAKDDVLILHPGPQNKGLEISSEVTYCERSAIQEQVQNGVAVRMALLDLTLNGGDAK
ncbi:MAG: aspartate carbamoyltransferase, partial [Selenomonadaceae bacterium]|nr:aspartate carbamoyltransferase [Selenomonadaceae bacterium]